MANLLLNPALWTDDAGHKPPSYWDGSKYVFIGDGDDSIISGPAAAGDIVSFTLNNITPPSQAGNSLSVYIGASIPRTLVYTNDLSAAGSFNFTSNPMQAGETCYVSTNGQFVSIYSCDFTIIPTPPTPHIVPQSPVTIVYD